MLSQPVFAQTSYDGEDLLLSGCLPPEDTELRQLVNENYQSFILKAQDYMKCLVEEQTRTFKKTNALLRRYLDYLQRASNHPNAPGPLDAVMGEEWAVYEAGCGRGTGLSCGA